MTFYSKILNHVFKEEFNSKFEILFETDFLKFIFFKHSYYFLIDYFFNIYSNVCDKQKRSFDFQTTKVIFNSIFSFNLVITLSCNFFVFNFDFDLFVSLVFIICNLKFNVEVLNNYVADINTISI